MKTIRHLPCSIILPVEGLVAATPRPPVCPRRGWFSLIACLLLGSSLVEVRASPIIVPNFSFEVDPVPDGGPSIFVASSWTATGSNFLAGTGNPQDAQYPGSSGLGDLPAPALGPQTGFIFLGGTGGGNLTTASSLATILADTTYKLTVAIGARLDFSSGEGAVVHAAIIALLANGMEIPGASLSIDSTALRDGAFADFTTSFTTGATGPLIGQSLTVRVSYVAENTSEVEFDNVRLDATPIPKAKAAVLNNISTRLRVETGDNVLIGGFIVTGTEPKKVILRAIGPSLGSANPPVPGALADTILELHEPDGTVISNDNWKETQKAEIIASTVPPTNDLESAIVATLDPGAYTAIVRGKKGASGIGLVEAYDLDQAADAQLANISTRGFVDAGDNVMIGGFIVGGGDGGARVIVRAIGPSLANANPPVPGALADTTLELYDGSGTPIASNDNWKETQKAEIIATTVPPTNDLESAIVATLPPGAYTVIMRGVGGTTGVGLVEAYNLAP